MLDNLLEIEVAYSLLKGGDAGDDPIDAHYKKLNTLMEVCFQYYYKQRSLLFFPLFYPFAVHLLVYDKNM